jgi:hypothetical protein
MRSEIARLRGKITHWFGVASSDGEAVTERNIEDHDARAASAASARRRATRVTRERPASTERVPAQRVAHADRLPPARGLDC